jgi:DMSO reductase family type II enzyme heme b subunit
MRAKSRQPLGLVLGAAALLGLAAACGGGDDKEATQTPQPTTAARATAVSVPSGTGTSVAPVKMNATRASITVDGKTGDWANVPAQTVKMEQIKPAPGLDFKPLPAINVSVKVAVDSERLYILLEVPDDFDYNPGDHDLSPAVAVMFRIDAAAPPHMGAEEDTPKISLGMVDIWHWELDCAPGEMSGQVTGGTSGNDSPCNFDDEYATTPEDREDDDKENSLAGVWEHTGRAGGIGATGTWIFEMSRRLSTGDSQDAQFTLGGTVYMALAYWDPDESPGQGWSDAGHLTSANAGWIEVQLP